LMISKKQIFPQLPITEAEKKLKIMVRLFLI
jgi:hypothetical protein